MAKRKSSGGFLFNVVNIGITVVMFALPTVGLLYWYVYLRKPAVPAEQVVVIERAAAEPSDPVMSSNQEIARSNQTASAPAVGFFDGPPAAFDDPLSSSQTPAEPVRPERAVRVERELRTWSDASGKFRIEAKFDGINGDQAKLHTADDRRIEVAIAKLSEVDKEYLRGVFKENGMHADF